MAMHSSILAWRIPWTEKPGQLQFVELQRVGHDWATNTHTHTHISHKITMGTKCDTVCEPLHVIPDRK